MVLIESTTSSKLTYQDLTHLEVEENELYELIDGKLMKRASPSTAHQRMIRKLMSKLDTYVTEKELGELFFAPYDVVLDKYNMVQPNLLFVSKANQKIIKETHVEGVPDLIVEVLSPSSIPRDRDIKMKLYARFKVPEYWIVDPVTHCFEVYVLTKQKDYRLHAYAYEEGDLHSTVIKDLVLEIKELH